MKFKNCFNLLALYLIVSCTNSIKIKSTELLDSEYNTVNKNISIKLIYLII